MSKSKLIKEEIELFHGIEEPKRLLLNKLMDDWKSEISIKPPILFHDDNKTYNTIDYFGTDGFFPNYFNQNTKVLFKGRESRNNSGNDSVLGTIDLEGYIKSAVLNTRK